MGLANKKIIITGCNGQLGKELIKQLQIYKDYEVIAADKNILNITNFDEVDRFINNNRPEIVINCAAHTAVDVCEVEVENAYKINALGPKNLAIACGKSNSKLVQISTDYVFDGFNKVPYKEDDITSTNSIYGKSKLMGENFVKEFCSKYYIIRTAWLYGDGKNFVKTMIELSKIKDEINVVNDQIGTPTSTADLSKCIIELINTQLYGTYHGTCEGECSWYEFAKKIFEVMNIDIKVNPITTNEFKRLAPRPMYSVLDNFMLKLINKNTFRHWEDSLIEYLELIKGEK